jgi:ankyrin repeat protein
MARGPRTADRPEGAFIATAIVITLTLWIVTAASAETRQQHLNKQLCAAINDCDATRLKSLLQRGAVLDPPGDYTALMRLCATGPLRFNAKFADLLVKSGADTGKQFHGETAFDIACNRLDDESLVPMVKWFLAHGANADGHGRHHPIIGIAGTTDELPGEAAHYRHSFEAVKVLVAHGARINVADADGDTPLIEACAQTFDDHGHERFQEKLALYLIAHGANVNARNTIAGTTPLIGLASVHDGRPRLAAMRVARELLNHGATADVRDLNERTALDLAGYYHFDALAALLESRQPASRRKFTNDLGTDIPSKEASELFGKQEVELMTAAQFFDAYGKKPNGDFSQGGYDQAAYYYADVKAGLHDRQARKISVAVCATLGSIRDAITKANDVAMIDGQPKDAGTLYAHTCSRWSMKEEDAVGKMLSSLTTRRSTGSTTKTLLRRLASLDSRIPGRRRPYHKLARALAGLPDETIRAVLEQEKHTVQLIVNLRDGNPDATP